MWVIDRKAFLLEGNEEWNKFVHNCSYEVLDFMELHWTHIIELLASSNRWEISNNDSQMYSNVHHLSVLYEDADYSEDLFQQLLSMSNNNEEKEEILEIISLKKKLKNDTLFWQFMEYGCKIIFPHPATKNIIPLVEEMNFNAIFLYLFEAEFYFKKRDDFVIWSYNKLQQKELN